MLTVGEIVKKTTDFFREKSETARLDSELLIANALGWERMQVYLKHDFALNDEQLEKCRALVRRRSKGEPVAYILGEKGFYKNTFEVTSATLIPRPETEMLVERGLEILDSKLPARGLRPKSPVQREIAAAAVKRAEAERTEALAEAARMGIDPEEVARAIDAANVDPNIAEDIGMKPSNALQDISVTARPHITIVDLGCGTGCIGLSIADEIRDRADLRLVFVDISAEALEVTRRNARKLGLFENSEFVTGDAGDIGLFSTLAGRADLVVANPPYIDPADTRVQEAVRQFEPATALFAGPAGEAGLLEIARWSIVAKALARPADSTSGSPGVSLFEIGDGQGPAVIDIFESAGWARISLSRDLANHERLIEAHLR